MKIKKLFKNVLLLGMSAFVATPYNVMAASLFEEDFQTADVLVDNNIKEKKEDNLIKKTDYHYEDENVILNAKVSDLENFPEGTELVASKLTGNNYDNAFEKVNNQFNNDGSNIIEFVPLKINFKKGEEIIKPTMDNVDYTLSFFADEFKFDRNTFLAAITEDGIVYRIENISTDSSELKFNADNVAVIGPVNIKEKEKEPEKDKENQQGTQDTEEDLVIGDNIKENIEEDLVLGEKKPVINPENDETEDNTEVNQEEISDDNPDIEEDILIGQEDTGNIEDKATETDSDNINPSENIESHDSDTAEQQKNTDKEFIAESESARVTAIVPEEAGFEIDTELKVEGLKEGSSEFDNAMQKVEDAFCEDGKKQVEFIPFDVSFLDKGNEVEPAAGIVNVEMEINKLDFQIDENTFIAHIKDDGTVERLENVSTIDGVLKFNVDSFSVMGPVRVVEDDRALTNADAETESVFVERKIATNPIALLYDTWELVFQDASTAQKPGNVVKMYESFIASGSHPWDAEKAKIKVVTFTDVIKPTRMSYWFSGCTNLVTVNNGNNLDMRSCTDMSYAFQNCNKLKTLDTSNWNLNCYNFNNVFENCYELEYIDTTSWTVRYGTLNLNNMFKNCKKLKSFDMSKWAYTYDDYSKDARTRDMFLGCDSLVYIKIGSEMRFGMSVGLRGKWKNETTGEVYYTSDTLPMNNHDAFSASTAGVYKYIEPETVYALRYSDGELVIQTDNSSDGNTSKHTLQETKEVNINKLHSSSMFTTSKSSVTKVIFRGKITPRYTAYWFQDFQNLISIENASNVNMSTCLDARYMFSGCSKTNFIDTSNWDLALCTNISYIFNNCLCINSIDVTKWNLSMCENISFAFYRCESLIDLNTLNWNLSKSKDMTSAFKSCHKLKRLDTSNWNLNCSSLNNMFEDCYELESIDTTSWKVKNITLDLNNMFKNCKKLKSFDMSKWAYTYDDYSKDARTQDMFLGCDSLVCIKIGSEMRFGMSVGLRGKWRNITNNTIYSNPNDLPMNGTDRFHSSNAGIYIQETQLYAILYNSGELVFQNMSTPVTSKGTVIKTYTIDQAATFSNESQVPWNSERSLIKTVDFYGSAIPVNANYWFKGCYNLTEIRNVNNFMLPQCNGLKESFYGCSSLKELNIEPFEPKSNIDTTNMLGSCNGLQKLIIGKKMKFNGAIGLPESKWSNITTSTVYNTVSALPFNASFNGANHSGIYIKGNILPHALLYSNGTLVFQIGDNADSSIGAVLKTFSINAITSTTPLWNTDKARIKKIIVKDKISPKITENWFSGCTNLTSVVSPENFDFSKTSSMNYMFKNTSMKYLDMSQWDTRNVKSLTGMLEGCTKLEDISLGENTFTGYLYPGLPGTWVNPNNGKEYNERYIMFGYIHNKKGMVGTFTNKSLLPIALLYDTGELVFQYNRVADPAKGKVIKTYITFIKEQYAEQTKESIPWNEHRAFIKSVTFNANIQPTNASYWFDGCYNLTTINNVNKLDFSNCQNMTSMFEGCSSLKELDMSTWTPQTNVNVTNMFTNCGSLRTLIVGQGMRFNTSSATNLGLTGIWKNETTNTEYKTPADLPFNTSFDGQLHAGTYKKKLLNADLTITNKVLGSMGNMTKEFVFTIKLTGATVPTSINYTKGSTSGTLAVSNGTATFKLMTGDSIKLNVPTGLRYEVTSTDALSSGYKVESANATGEVSQNATISFTLTRNGVVPTSSDTNAVPMVFIAITSGALGLIYVFLYKKKRKT